MNRILPVVVAGIVMGLNAGAFAEPNSPKGDSAHGKTTMQERAGIRPGDDSMAEEKTTKELIKKHHGDGLLEDGKKHKNNVDEKHDNMRGHDEDQDDDEHGRDHDRDEMSDGLHKQREMKMHQEQKELGRGSEQGQDMREQHSRKWWKFWE